MSSTEQSVLPRHRCAAACPMSLGDSGPLMSVGAGLHCFGVTFALADTGVGQADDRGRFAGGQACTLAQGGDHFVGGNVDPLGNLPGLAAKVVEVVELAGDLDVADPHEMPGIVTFSESVPSRSWASVCTRVSIAVKSFSRNVHSGRSCTVTVHALSSASARAIVRR